jgi:lysophospholipase L1-like esterase
MNISSQHLQTFATGVDRVELLPKDGVRLHRLPQKMLTIYAPNEAQRARAECTAGVRLRFVSDTKWIRVALRHGEPVRWYFLCVLTVDGERMDAFGAVSRQETWEGLAFTQEKRARHLFEIWLPHLCPTEISSLEVEDGCALEAAPPLAFKWLAWGDSITQGMNASLPIFSWTARAARELNANVINYGVGGATLQKELATALPHTEANLITISYGANDWNIALPLAEFRANAAALVSALRKQFPSTPLIVTTPVPFFRASAPNKNGDSLDDFRRALEEVAAEQKVHAIRGTDLVPADHNYFNDWSHPNDAGHQMIAQNLLAAVQALGLTENQGEHAQR